MDRDILHVLPQEYVIDSMDSIKDPIGLTGRRLEARVHIITVATSAATNLASCAEELGVNVDELYLIHPETLEDGLIAIEEAAKSGVLDAVIFDSLDAATARGTLHKKGSQGKPGVARDIDDDTIALKPRQLSQWFPRVQLSFRKYATTLIIIAQQRIQMSGIMAYQGMSGGNALKHSNILNLTMT